MKKIVLFLWLLFSLQIPLPAQLDSIVFQLETITVSTPKIRQQFIGGLSTRWNTQQLNNISADNVAELLDDESSVFIKSYGLNSLATSSIRGGSAGHTLVLWNGLPIQSPMLGLLDLSLLPTNSAEEIILQKGGNTALWGSGAIGGTLALNNKSITGRQVVIDVSSAFGSFGAWKPQAKLSLGNGAFQSVTKFSHHQADNDFFYPVAPGLPDRQQTNARFNQQNLQQDFYWFFKKHQKLAFHFWRQTSDRELPPTNVQTRSEAQQNDRSNRMILDWELLKKKTNFSAKLGYFEEYLDYFDDQIGLVSKSNFNTFLADFNTQWNLKKQHQLAIGMTHTYTRALANGYEETITDYRQALFGTYTFDKNKWHIQTSLRQAFNNSTFAPLTPSIGVDYQIIPHLAIKAKISRNFRIPTLNDRFWTPGGNEDLKAERGWSEELSLVFKLKKENYTLDLSLTAFNRIIDNWILWSLKPGDSFWSANNITKVWSRGLEPRFSYNWFKAKVRFRFDLGYDWIRSTNQVALQAPRIAEGTQLIYTPKHQASGKVTLMYKNTQLSYQHQYTDSTQGVNEVIDAFHTGNLRLQYHMHFNQSRPSVFLSILNIWDQRYFVIERRPMPGRNWQVGLRFHFNTK